MRFSTLSSPLLAAVLLGLAATVSIAPSSLLAIDFYWDANGSSSGTGGTGTWTTNNLWRNGSATGTLGNWTSSATNNAYFGGTAGVVSIGSTAVTAGTAFFSTTGYTLQTDASGTTRIYTGAISLGNSVNLNLMDAATTAGRALSIGSVSGGTGSSLTLQGAQTSNNISRINLAVSGATIDVPTTINATGAGGAGYVATATGTIINGTITNNSTNARTILGATSGNALTMNAKVTGSANLMFAAGPSGGTGTITLNVANDYTGDTIFNAGNNGVIRLGITDALPVGTNVTMANTSSNGGILDLFGFDQTIASLTSGVGGGSITNGGAAGGTNSNTLTINGSSSPAPFGLAITNGTNRTIALVRSGSGTTTLSGTSTFTGGTTVSGTSTLTLGHTTNTLADTGAILVNGGTFNVANPDTVGSVTLSSGSISGAGTLTGSSYALTNIGSVSAILAGTGTLTKTGTGTATISSANTYTGGTTLSSGTLNVTNTTASATGTGNVLIQDTATLQGSGRIAPTTGGTIIVQDGGTVAIGDLNGTPAQGAKILTITPATGTITTTFQTDSTIRFDLFTNAGDNTAITSAADLFRTGGNLTFQDGVILSVNKSGTFSFADGDKWRLLDWEFLGGSITGTASQLTLDLPTLDNGLFWDVSSLYTNGSIAVMIPEPSRTLFLALGLLTLTLRRRR
jgi:autotransporter-associated beta strand protein